MEFEVCAVGFTSICLMLCRTAAIFSIQKNDRPMLPFSESRTRELHRLRRAIACCVDGGAAYDLRGFTFTDVSYLIFLISRSNNFNLSTDKNGIHNQYLGGLSVCTGPLCLKLNGNVIQQR